MIGPEQLTRATFAPPSRIELEFADGLWSSLAISRIGIPVEMITWSTVKVPPGGDKIIVKGIKGESIPIDAATLRYLVDAKYAAKIDRSIRALHMTPAEAEEAAKRSILTRDPRWNEVGDEDDLFE